ncbi:alkene reductase [Candidimonas nitroreducens]|uniref:Alkene reductase n=1 Tax=Candidimonas nitroreducens TaxID=683354 RepID=A0A225MY96_9BURK|nr:alkene reductase [Candidimonas nitroreducens]OWT66228.1 alkene reductase [Candidimonas nitroreducens]
MTDLFQPVRLGATELKNRIVMSPLTRTRASAGRVPNDLMLEYYRQRAGAGLILSEATVVSAQGVGYPDTPGIWSPEQVQGWRRITRAVHEHGGKMFLQLWHVGRVSDPVYLDGNLPVAPSAIPCGGHVSLLRPRVGYVTPRALDLAELPGIVADFERGARNALEAGFDGVEVHGANGYLLDQFLQDGTNKRLDAYGGPIQNRARLLLEVVDICVGVWGAERVGVHLSPRGGAHSVSDSNPAALFSHVAAELGRRGLAFLCVREALGPDSLLPVVKRAFGGPIIANEGFDLDSAQQVLGRGDADAVAFGKLYIANPDLAQRLRNGSDLNRWNAETFYASGPEGYTDYPSLESEADAAELTVCGG